MSQPEGASAEPRRNPHASASRWRHQESSRYARYASERKGQKTHGHIGSLAHFLSSHRGEEEQEEAAPADNETTQLEAVGSRTDGREIVCGPLLNYHSMEQGHWKGSVLIVVRGGGTEVIHEPTLNLRRLGDSSNLVSEIGNNEASEHEPNNAATSTSIKGDRLYSDTRSTFWVFDIRVPLERAEIKYAYEIEEMRYSALHKPTINNFFIPAQNESMRMMFHSCNGFSVGTDEDAYSGAPLWNDVLRKHEKRPFHVMLGGGDQIYNDGIRVNGPLKAWTAIGNPQKRQHYPFSEKLRAECDDYYLNNYIQWYNSAPFAVANGQIPQVNIWDDHDVRISKREKVESTLLTCA